MNSKYSNLLTVLLIIVIIAIVGIIGFLGYRYYKNEQLKNNSEDFVDSFLNDSNIGGNNNNSSPIDNNVFTGVDEGTNTGNTTTPGEKPKFNGYDMIGTIEIPATNVKQPILSSSELSKSSLETSVVEIYGPGLNQVGNTTIAGHNYRDGRFFSNNKKLVEGDKVYITDTTGQKITYTIYKIYTTSPEDSSYLDRDTEGRREISLTTCTDDAQSRLIIWAKEQ